MPRYFLHFAYKGTDFHGWQRQENATSIQECIEQSLAVVCREQISTTGQGRTDTGVHAASCYAHFDTEQHLHDTEKLARSLNALLPDSIAVFEVFKVPSEAHARFTALSRTYEYRMHRGKNPFKTGSSTELHFWPEADLIQQAIPFFLGKHDFGCFAKVGGNNKTNICDLTHLSWQQTNHEAILSITADRFLRNMVRAITGTLLEVGCHKRSPASIPALLSSGSRSLAGESVSAQGLFLTEVSYPEWVFSHRHV